MAMDKGLALLKRGGANLFGAREGEGVDGAKNGGGARVAVVARKGSSEEDE